MIKKSIGQLDVDEGGGAQLRQQNNNNDAAVESSNTNVLSFLNFSSWTGGGDEIVGSHINNTDEGEGSEAPLLQTFNGGTFPE